MADRTLIIDIVKPGDPVSKGRPRFSKRGESIVTFTPAATRAAEDEWKWVITASASSYCRSDADFDYRIEVHFYTKTWQRRDLDNMLKLVSDACNGLVYRDDAQVTEVEASLVRSDPNPRTELRIYRLPPRRAP